MASVEAGARRRTLSSDRAADLEDAEEAEVRRREAEGQRRARPVSLSGLKLACFRLTMRPLSVTVHLTRINTYHYNHQKSR